MTPTERAGLGREAMKAGTLDRDQYVKDSAIDTIANVLHAYGAEWGAKIGTPLAEDVFEQALRRYEATL